MSSMRGLKCRALSAPVFAFGGGVECHCSRKFLHVVLMMPSHLGAVLWGLPEPMCTPLPSSPWTVRTASIFIAVAIGDAIGEIIVGTSITALRSESMGSDAMMRSAIDSDLPKTAPLHS